MASNTAIAERYAAEGAVVAIVSSHSLERAEGVAAAIRGNGGNAQAFVADCAKVAEIRRLAGEVSRHLGGVDILVNNAGIMHTASIEETTEEKWDAQLDLNLKGAFFLTQACLSEFRRKGRGKVINVTSIWGIGAGPNCPAYCASKGGLRKPHPRARSRNREVQHQRQLARAGQYRYAAQRPSAGP